MPREPRFYKEANPKPRVCLVLGAGNVNSIPATDVVTKLFAEGKPCASSRRTR